MDINKLYKAAKKAGLDTFEVRISDEERIEISSFNGEQESYVVAGNGEMRLRGIADGKCGSFASDRVDDDVIDAAVAAVKESALYGQPAEPEFFIKGGEYEYEKVNAFNAALDAVPAAKLSELCCSVGKRTAEMDKRITNVSASLEYVHIRKTHGNSNGLDLHSEANYLLIFAQCSAVADGVTESGSHFEFINDFDAFDVGAFAKTLADRTVDQLGGKSVKSGKYKAVYSNRCMTELLYPIAEALSGFNVEQHISPLEGKVGTRVFDGKVTLKETPIGSLPFCRAFDAEGVPCSNKTHIDKGVLNGFVYDLATAKRAGVESTGNGALVNGNIRPCLGMTVLENGDSTLEQLFKTVGDGLYITSLSGGNAGMDMKSGAYSLQASGYVIKNGALATPVSLITVAGNVFEDLKNVLAVGNDGLLSYNEIQAPSIAVSEISVSGT